MGTPDAEGRALFEAASSPLYEEIAGSGGVVAGDPRIEPGGELHAPFEQLRELGLVRLDADKETWVAEDPGLVHTRVVAPLSQQGAELLQESSRWTEAFGALTPGLAPRPRHVRAGPVPLPARRRDDQPLPQASSRRPRRRC